LLKIFNTEGGGLGALRWLLEGNFYKERKRATRGRVWVLAVNSLFLAGLVVYNFYRRGRRLGCFEVAA
jgi:hypothetical protein